jgi:hypothetical protein
LKHHTKTKGDIGLVKVLSDLSDKGLDCLLPISEHLPFDLIAFDQDTGKTYKVQCKFKKKTNGVIDVPIRTSHMTTTGSVSSRYNYGSFDVLAVYNPDTNTVYYVAEKELTDKTTSIKLRVDAPNTRYCKEDKCNMAVDYTAFPLNSV